MNNYYITTTLPYVNSDPHIGFALEIVQADVLARYHRLLGEEVVFNTGTDEHGQKIYQNALEAGKDPKAYTDEYAARFDALKQALNLTYTNFIRTTDEHHVKAAQEMWKRCEANGDIYKKAYQTKYCVGCELEKTDSELVDGHCDIHPNLEIELRDEENYFFRWSKYQDALLKHYEENPEFVVPKGKLNEIRTFVEGGLQDFSISRLKEKMPWGVEVPGDADHVMYVWFDALTNYISTLGWPEDEKNFNAFWPGVQVAGKDNLRQQSAMWQGMLLSAGLPLSKQVFIHGFITAEGQKMSKSLGNVVDPFSLVEEVGADTVRYYLLGSIPSHNDGDFSRTRFDEMYASKLANGIGNLTARVITMVEKYTEGKVPEKAEDPFGLDSYWKRYEEALTQYRFDELVKITEELAAACDAKIDEEKPWVKAKAGEDVGPLLYQLLETIRHLSLLLSPIIPETADKISEKLGLSKVSADTFNKEWGGLASGGTIEKGDALFPRRDS